MSKIKPSISLLFTIFFYTICQSQIKRPVTNSITKDSLSLVVFLKDLNKELITKQSLKVPEKNKRPYKTLTVYYFKDKIILSPVKSDL